MIKIPFKSVFKNLITLALVLSACTTTAQSSPKISGEKIISSLLDASDVALSNEPLCDMKSVSFSGDAYTLKDHLSVILSTSYESINKTQIKTSCEESKHELTTADVIAILDCKLVLNESSPDGKFISASTIAFGLDKENLEYVPASLKCF